MVSRSARISGRIQEGHDAFALIIVQNKPGHGEHKRNEQQTDSEYAPLHPMKQHHASEQRHDSQPCAQIRLLHDKGKRHQTYAQNLEQPQPVQ